MTPTKGGFEMAEKAPFMTWAKENYPKIIENLRSARRMILLTTLVFAVAGATIGKLSTSVTSTAQLVVAPMPFLKSPDGTDPIARMIAGDINVKTVVLLCTSDETFQKTFDTLSRPETLSTPPKTLNQLKSALSHRITIEKETPYDLDYSPILELTARAKVPSDARTMVNAWAAACEESAKRYQQAFHTPSVKAFETELASVFSRYDEAQKDYAKFQNENILEFLKARLTTVVASIAELEKSRTTLLKSITENKARVESLHIVLEDEAPKITVDWRPSSSILMILAGSLGINKDLSKPEGERPETGPPLLQIEHINDNYMTLRENLAMARVGLAAGKAGLDDLDSLLALRGKELLDYQDELTAAVIEDARLKTIVDTYTGAYSNVLGKMEFAQIAKKLTETPQVRVLSEGAEWRMPRFRQAILLGFGAGVCGFILAACYSIFIRLVFAPVLRG